jgi:hypothetical protein
MLSRKGNWTGCENQKALDYTTLVKEFMEQIGQDPASGPYAYYCGAPMRSHTLSHEPSRC